MPSSSDESAEELQLRLSQSFAAGMLDATDYESAFLGARGSKWSGTRGTLADVLDQVFYAVDDYVADESIRDPANGDLDEEQLREIVRTQLRRLDEAGPDAGTD